MIVPDNLKTGVEKSSRTDSIINRTYQEMAEYYNTTIMPARVRHPKDYLQNHVIFKNRADVLMSGQ
jgi:transcription initiation factor TFIIIB Brf1 subunit/transcription initiation factor TFIIB